MITDPVPTKVKSNYSRAALAKRKVSHPTQTDEELLDKLIQSRNAAAHDDKIASQIDKAMGEELNRTIQTMYGYIDKVKAQ